MWLLKEGEPAPPFKMSKSFVIVANYAVLPEGILEKGPLYIRISNGKISSIQKQAPPELHNCMRAHLVTPGFIDIHTHGYGELHYSICTVEPLIKGHIGASPFCRL